MSEIPQGPGCEDPTTSEGQGALSWAHQGYGAIFVVCVFGGMYSIPNLKMLERAYRRELKSQDREGAGDNVVQERCSVQDASHKATSRGRPGSGSPTARAAAGQSWSTFRSLQAEAHTGCSGSFGHAKPVRRWPHSSSWPTSCPGDAHAPCVSAAAPHTLFRGNTQLAHAACTVALQASTGQRLAARLRPLLRLHTTTSILWWPGLCRSLWVRVFPQLRHRSGGEVMRISPAGNVSAIACSLEPS